MTALAAVPAARGLCARGFWVSQGFLRVCTPSRACERVSAKRAAVTTVSAALACCTGAACQGFSGVCEGSAHQAEHVSMSMPLGDGGRNACMLHRAAWGLQGSSGVCEGSAHRAERDPVGAETAADDDDRHVAGRKAQAGRGCGLHAQHQRREAVGEGERRCAPGLAGNTGVSNIVILSGGTAGWCARPHH